MFGKLFWNIGCIMLAFTLIVPALPAAQAQEAAWTIIYYSVSDTNLEDVQMLDFNEMEMVGSTSDVNIVVQIDRAEGYTDVDGDWTDARRYLVTQDPTGDWESTQSTLLAELGEVNMGDPAVLVDFALWTIENYPAEKYALFLADHGAGWPGFGGDESTPNFDSFTMLEIDGALREIVETTGVRFELIGFDACLMNQLEIHKMLAPYAHYALVAEETEPGFGWAYNEFLLALVDDPYMDGAELGEVIVDTYMNFYTELVTDYEQFDLSVIDLSEISGVDVAMNNFVRVVQANIGEMMSAIGSARNNVQFFGSTNPDEADEISSVDLLHFLELLIRLSPNAEVNDAAQELIDAVSRMIVYQRANPGLPNARGMAIYFPRNQRIYNMFQSYEAYNYTVQVPYMSDWNAFLQSFYGQTVAMIPEVEDAEKVISILGVYPPDTVNIHKPAVVVFHFDGKEIAEVSFSSTLLLEDGGQIMLDESPLEYVVYDEEGEPITDFPDEPTDSEFTWGAEMPVITDGAVTVPTLLIGNPMNPDTVSISGTYLPQSGEPVTAYLAAALETFTVTNVWGSVETGGFSAPFEITPKPGDQFLPTWRFLNEDKEYELMPADSDPLTFGETPFKITYE
ncbi:MAG: hypothetical protein GF311_27425, partial [Candidatus Lokiarchaeota archaeon]|nr:hypothetical protein [Candidatus Lokiarchaeota archaeon]